MLQAGAIIPAALITGIRSDLPGRITAQATENIYDSPTGRILLVPQGMRVVGQYDIRRETVEHPFGSIKQWMIQGAFLMRGRGNVRTEFSLTALAYNLGRVIILIGIPGLIRAVTV